MTLTPFRPLSAMLAHWSDETMADAHRWPDAGLDDATQHLFNCQGRMLSAPVATIHNVADLLGVDAERVRLWMFARSAAEPRDNWNDDSVALARVLARERRATRGSR